MYEHKKNIFDHILYEIEMYIATYKMLFNYALLEDKLLNNMVLESHAIHLRNLIEFFNCEKNCITTETIFLGSQDFTFVDLMNAKKTINKTIEHLTLERVKWYNTEKDLTKNFSLCINLMFESIMMPRIQRFIDLLMQENTVKERYKCEINEDFIQRRLNHLNEEIG